MPGAAARAIQELAGHQDLATTDRYMHLNPGAIDAVIPCWIPLESTPVVEK
jgi:site-specific recombinase XerD